MASSEINPTSPPPAVSPRDTTRTVVLPAWSTPDRGRHRPLPGRIPVGLLLAAHRLTPTTAQGDQR